MKLERQPEKGYYAINGGQAMEPEYEQELITEFRRRQALTSLECAINLMASDFDIEEIRSVLIGMADDLSEYG